jgi:hypothetical protein
VTSRISHLTCTSCGTDQRVRIEDEVCDSCYACGGRDFASWPHLEVPPEPIPWYAQLDAIAVVHPERLNEFMRAVFGEYKADDE